MDTGTCQDPYDTVFWPTRPQDPIVLVLVLVLVIDRLIPQAVIPILLSPSHCKLASNPRIDRADMVQSHDRTSTSTSTSTTNSQSKTMHRSGRSTALHGDLFGGHSVMVVDNRIDSPVSVSRPTFASNPFYHLQSMAVAAIRCQDIRVVFDNRTGKQTILDDLNLTVPAGQIMTLLGPSGCGKSTLLRVIAGLTKPNSGTLGIEGKSIAESQHKLAFVFQESALLPWRTVYQNVRLPWEIRKKQSSTDIESRIQNALDLVGFKPNDWNKKPHQLSGGMKMRASIARALITNPDILLLDEPFAALDDMLRSKLNDLLLKIVDQTQTTMLFVTHNISEAIYLSHSIAVFSQGRIGEVIDVDLPVPRTTSLRSSPEFAAMYGRVSQSLARNAAQ